MSSFDDQERISKLAVMPKRSNHGKVVKLAPKQLETKKELRTVLPEEQYLENLDKIITRKFFPEVPKLQAQAEYMDAMGRNDVAKMRELQLRYNTQRRTDRRTSPSARPCTSPTHFDPDTPGPSKLNPSSPLPFTNEEGDNEKAEAKKKKAQNELEKMSVDQYLNKFTSEDNASFEELTALAEKRNYVKNKHVYDAAEAHNKDMIYRGAIAASADVQLALKYDDEANAAKPLALDNWEYKVLNHALFYPEGAQLTAEEKIAQTRMNQREINVEATRFSEDVKNKPSEASMARAAMIHAAQNAGKVDVMGREAQIPAKALGLLATPNIAPGIDDTPLMTWGEIDGTPFRLDATDVQAPIENAPAFKMPEVPYREQIAQGISDTIAQRYRDKRKTAMETAEKAHKTPRFGSIRSTDRVGLLSPAAKRLATNKLGIRLGSGSSSKSSINASPSLLVRRPSSTKSSCASPAISSMVKLSTPKSKTTTSSITDNLMQVADEAETSVPSTSTGRAKASDFF